MQIPLEDNFEDIIGKAQRGLELSDEELSFRAGISIRALQDMKSGIVLDGPARLAARELELDADSLLAIGRHMWRPSPVKVDGLIPFTTDYGRMTVNSFLVCDPVLKSAALFDTGADAAGPIAAIADLGLHLERIFLTHSHSDHIAALPALRKAFPDVSVYAGRGDLPDGAQPVDDGMTFPLGSLTIELRETSGHARCGMTYVVRGLARPLAIVGDALFAGSMGGAAAAWIAALTANRHQIFSLPDNTVICPGHGPLTTVAEEKAHNPFYPEFKTPTH